MECPIRLCTAATVFVVAVKQLIRSNMNYHYSSGSTAGSWNTELIAP